MTSTTDTANEIRSADNEAALAEATALSESEQKDVVYGKWVEVDYDKSLKGIYTAYKDGDTVPFSNMIIGGSNNKYTSFGSLLMDNSDTYGTSSYFKAVLKEGWMVRFNLLTENENYFDQNIDEALLDRLDFYDSPAGSWDEEIDFTLQQQDDFISIDIDNESTDVGQFTLRIGGVKYTVEKPDEMDNEAKVWVREVWRFDTTYGTVVYDGQNQEGDDEQDGEDQEESEPEDDEEDEGEGEQESPPEDDVSIAGMLLLLAGVAATVFLALKVV